ncbi:MAG TPA: hypothetical protein VJY65_06280 [Chloroflexota bacterium]|nr:hypothetical protein [Chloroflexota bacterium]
MAAFVRAGVPPLHGAAVGAVGTLCAPLRVAAPDEVLSTLARLRCGGNTAVERRRTDEVV